MKKIDRPDWHRICVLNVPAQAEALDYWFTVNVEDKINKALDSAVEVYGGLNSKGNYVPWIDNPDGTMDTNKALLINIEPIKQETCADVAKEMIDKGHGCAPIGKCWMCEFNERFKAALEREK